MAEHDTLDASTHLVVTLIENGGTFESRISPEAKGWAEKNAEFVHAYNAMVDEHGVFGEEFRTW